VQVTTGRDKSELHELDRDLTGLYFFDADSPVTALDEFHETVPIKVLDDFDISVELVERVGGREEGIGVGGWELKAAKLLVGKTIAAVRYMTLDEAEGVGFCRRPLLIVFKDNSYIYASKDDEGNDAGALFTSFDDLPTIPVIN
jgi:hypothetical protein